MQQLVRKNRFINNGKFYKVEFLTDFETSNKIQFYSAHVIISNLANHIKQW